MKLVWVVIALAVALTGVGAACGPEEKYCFDEHLSCKEAAQLKDKKKEEEAAEKERIRKELEAGELGDGGATTIGQ
jgi:hypothetical protein